MKTFVALLLLALAVCAHATTYSVSTSQTSAAIQRTLSQLKAGDVLNFASGVYNNVNLNLNGLVGSASSAITINGYNATIKCGGSVAPITIGGCANVNLNGFTITTTGAKNIPGINFVQGVANVVLNSLNIVNTNGNGITLNVNNVVGVTIQNSQFSGCGKIQSTGGVAISIGSSHTVLKNVADIVIDNNVISAINSVGAAISVGLGVVAPQVTQNVVSDVTNAISVVTGINTDVLSLLPRVFGNLVLDASSIGLNLGAGVQAVNNIVAGCSVGINLVTGGSISVLSNTTIAHNTVYGVTDTCLQVLSGLPDASLVIVNNALAVGNSFSTSKRDVVSTLLGTVLNLVDGLLGSVATILNNVVSGVLGKVGSFTSSLPLLGHLNLGADVDTRQIPDLPDLGFLGVALNDLFSGLSTVVQELKLLPLKALVNEILTTVADVVDQVNTLVQNLIPDVQQILNNLVPNLENLLDALGLGAFLDPVLDALLPTLDQLLDDVAPVVDDVNNFVQVLVPTLEADLAPLLTTTLHKVENVLSKVLTTLGSTLQTVLGDLHLKRQSASPVDLQGLLQTIQTALNLVLGNLASDLDVTNVLGGVLTTVDDILQAITEGTLSNSLLDSDLLGLGGLLDAVVQLVQQVLTAVDNLLSSLLSGLNNLGLPEDFLGNVRQGRFTIGAVQATADMPTLGSFLTKLSASTRSVAVANIRSQ